MSFLILFAYRRHELLSLIKEAWLSVADSRDRNAHATAFIDFVIRDKQVLIF
jgi:hypothetical protein